MKEEISALRGEGWTYKRIGEKFKLSWQRVHQIHTNYRSPGGFVPTESLKVLNKRKRESLGLLTVKSGGGGRNYRRELVRARDNYTCQICKKIWTVGRALDVHHLDLDPKKTRQIDPVTEFKNMVTLCHKCHLRLHHGLAHL